LAYANKEKEIKRNHAARVSGTKMNVQVLTLRLSALHAFWPIVAMLLAVVAVYWPPPAQPNSVQIALDYWQLHARRMEFARDGLFASAPVLPAWYPRELFGTPFWSNVQNFPFIPTRLLVLLTMDPAGPYTYAIAVTLSAGLAALFTYLYMRKLGVGLTGAAAAGWTFACSGYYASRVAAGHLPLLEAYPGLPLLMWVVESLIQAHRRDEPLRRWIGLTAISSSCVMLAGHPQLPVYAMGVAGLYALWRGGLGRAFRIWSFMVLGVGAAAFALVPMGMLINRSTRVLALAPPPNDLSMPYGRLAAFFLPWRDGMPPLLDPANANPFHGYPNLAYFWDTVCYTGLLPWIAVIILLSFGAKTKFERHTTKVALFVAVSGLAGIVLSLPVLHQAASVLPGTILRSPARLIYLTEFALALALGAGIHAVFATAQPRVARVVVPLLLSIHFIDLGAHDRQFILRGSLGMPRAESEIFENIFRNVGDGRAAIDYHVLLSVNRRVDDVGFFDSIMLARPYGAILSLANAPRALNIQTFNGSEMSLRALAAVGVKFVVTTVRRDDLRSEGDIYGITIYSISSPSGRAEFFDADNIKYMSTEAIHAKLRDRDFDLSSLLLPLEAMPSEPQSMVKRSNEHAMVEYRRPNSDHIECTVTTGQSGYLRIIESWDSGWSATVDGSPVPIVPALDALLAVPIGPGRHEVRFIYRTPGAVAGRTISLVSLVLLCGVIWFSSLKRRR
jgi:Bacterial membrane protein YfhO